MGLMGFLNLPVFKELLHIIDPLTYLPEMARIPKYVIVAAGDEVRNDTCAPPQSRGATRMSQDPNMRLSLSLALSLSPM